MKKKKSGTPEKEKESENSTTRKEEKGSGESPPKDKNKVQKDSEDKDQMDDEFMTEIFNMAGEIMKSMFQGQPAQPSDSLAENGEKPQDHFTQNSSIDQSQEELFKNDEFMDLFDQMLGDMKKNKGFTLEKRDEESSSPSIDIPFEKEETDEEKNKGETLRNEVMDNALDILSNLDLEEEDVKDRKMMDKVSDQVAEKFGLDKEVSGDLFADLMEKINQSFLKGTFGDLFGSMASMEDEKQKDSKFPREKDTQPDKVSIKIESVGEVPEEKAQVKNKSSIPENGDKKLPYDQNVVKRLKNLLKFVSKIKISSLAHRVSLKEETLVQIIKDYPAYFGRFEISGEFLLKK